MSRRYAGIAKNILLYLAIAGIVAIAATSPYFLWDLLKRAGRSSYAKKNASTTFSRLRNSNLIKISKNNDGSFVVELTEEGKRKAKEIQLYNSDLPKPTRWDGIWRVVIFDIPNKKKIAREALRRKLKGWKFYQLQESVWVCPWPCEKEIEIVSNVYEITPFVSIIEAHRIQNDDKLKKHFKLI